MRRPSLQFLVLSSTLMLIFAISAKLASIPSALAQQANDPWAAFKRLVPRQTPTNQLSHPSPPLWECWSFLTLSSDANEDAELSPGRACNSGEPTGTIAAVAHAQTNMIVQARITPLPQTPHTRSSSSDLDNFKIGGGGIFFDPDHAAPHVKVIASGMSRPISVGMNSQTEETLTFPDHSIIVKTTWLAVTNEANNLSKLPLATRGQINKSSGGQFVTTDVAFSTQPPSCTEGNNPLPTTCFYSRHISPIEMSRIKRQGLTAGALQVGDLPGQTITIVLLGFNIMFKDSHGTWHWQTFWWDKATLAHPSQQDPWYIKHMKGNPYLINGDADPNSPWSHYVMDEMTSSTAATYNPYLEGTLPNGSSTNCLSCHTQASYYKNAQPNQATCDFKLDIHDYLARAGSATVPAIENCPNRLGTPMKTDKVWDLAESNNAPPQ